MEAVIPKIFQLGLRIKERLVGERKSSASPFSDYNPKLISRYDEREYGLGEITKLFHQQEIEFERLLKLGLRYKEDLLAIRKNEVEESGEPCWGNHFFGGLDLVSLYTIVRELKPKRFVEIGSGTSTKVVKRAVRDGYLETQITSIDPKPRSFVETICDRAIREGLEDVDLRLFEDLEAGDVLFFDGSHRCLMNSDVTVFFLEVLPRLKKGVVVHIHDIFLPFDYPQEWADRLYSEQYMLAAVLLFGNRLRPVFASNYVAKHGKLSKVLEPLWEDPRFPVSYREGVSFWATTL